MTTASNRRRLCVVASIGGVFVFAAIEQEPMVVCALAKKENAYQRLYLPLIVVQRPPRRSHLISGRPTARICSAVALPLIFDQRSLYRSHLINGRSTTHIG